MACEYCDGGYYNKPIVNMPTLGAIAGVGRDTCALIIQLKDLKRTKLVGYINYCPMCGRKLSDEQ